jgi:hypothetical protein
VIRECTEHYDVGSADAEWPNNIISQKAVVYGSGVIARQDDPVEHRVDADELSLCKQLAAEVCKIMEGSNVDMGSESADSFREFFIVANVDDPRPETIDENLIRSKFRGTLFPLVSITVEPLEELGTWWSEVTDSGYEGEEQEDYLQPWRSMIQWFHSTPELMSPVFVRIGDAPALWNVPKDQYPEGTEITGAVLPRLAVGLSRNGSLVGIFGYSVQT